MLPTCCLPLWGREGVTLLGLQQRISELPEKEDFNKAKNSTTPQAISFCVLDHRQI
jgi:hypothetical protein